MGNVENPYLVRVKYYSERSFRNEAFFEDESSANKELEELRAISRRDWVQVVDLRTWQVIADSRAR